MLIEIALYSVNMFVDRVPLRSIEGQVTLRPEIFVIRNKSLHYVDITTKFMVHFYEQKDKFRISKTIIFTLT